MKKLKIETCMDCPYVELEMDWNGCTIEVKDLPDPTIDEFGDEIFVIPNWCPLEKD